MLTSARTANRVAMVAATMGLAIGLQPRTVPLVQIALPASAAQALAQAGGIGPSARRAFANLPGVRLWFTDTGGNGEPVVLMHEHRDERSMGAPGGGVFEGRLPGDCLRSARLGRSEADPATGAQPGHASEDLQALADYLLLGRFHLVGVAGGGFVALDYAAWQTERVSSLVVGASTGSVSDQEIQDFVSRIEIPGIRSLPAHYREVSVSYRGAPKA